jgi:hypothetical protein
MTILHLGHQPADVGVDPALMSTTAGDFDAALDNNAVRIASGSASGYFVSATLGFNLAAPSNDLWLQFRFNQLTAVNASQAYDRDYVVFRSATGVPIARLQYWITNGLLLRFRTQVWNGTAWVSGAGYDAGTTTGVRWFDFRLQIGANVTLEWYLNGVLVDTATATNGAGFTNATNVAITQLASPTTNFNSQISTIAHIAAMHGVSTVNRRFVRMRPDTAGYINQWAGSPAALADGLMSTSMVSSAVAQRTAFTVASPTIPTHTAIAAMIHAVKGEGVTGRTRIRPFTRHSGTNHDAAAAAELAPGAVRARYVPVAQNPATAAPWTQATLPDEYGLLSEA